MRIAYSVIAAVGITFGSYVSGALAQQSTPSTEVAAAPDLSGLWQAKRRSRTSCSEAGGCNRPTTSAERDTRRLCSFGVRTLAYGLATSNPSPTR